MHRLTLCPSQDFLRRTKHQHHKRPSHRRVKQTPSSEPAALKEQRQCKSPGTQTTPLHHRLAHQRPQHLRRFIAHRRRLDVKQRHRRQPTDRSRPSFIAHSPKGTRLYPKWRTALRMHLQQKKNTLQRRWGRCLSSRCVSSSKNGPCWFSLFVPAAVMRHSDRGELRCTVQ